MVRLLEPQQFLPGMVKDRNDSPYCRSACEATATATGKLESAFSNIVTVQAYTANPVVTSPIAEGATSVSGTSTEGDGTTIDVYVNGSSVGTTTVQ